MATMPAGLINPSDAPFFYGWRDVTRVRRDGSVVFDRVPLTGEDVLHPQEGDVILQGSAHDRRRTYLAGVCTMRLADDPNAVGGDDLPRLSGMCWGSSRTARMCRSSWGRPNSGSGIRSASSMRGCGRH